MTIYELVLRLESLHRFYGPCCVQGDIATNRTARDCALGLLNDYCIRRRLITIVSIKLDHFYGYIYNMIQKGFYVSYSKNFKPF